MFTGIIRKVAEVRRVSRRSGAAVLRVALCELAQEVGPGDSVAVDGVCVTATKVQNGEMEFDVSSETLSLTTLGGLRQGDEVNVELALRAGDRFGGHFVSGHVDGTGTIRQMRRLAGECRMTVAAGAELLAQMVQKGSVAVDGVSLTVARLLPDAFEVSLIPYTLEATTLGRKRPGDRVNIECDMIGKYVRRLQERNSAAGQSGGSIAVQRLAEEGF